MNKRLTDKSWCKFWWDRLTPWCQVSGFIILCGFYGGSYFTQFQAQASTLKEHSMLLTSLAEKDVERDIQLEVMNQKLDDLLIYLKVPAHGH